MDSRFQSIQVNKEIKEVFVKIDQAIQKTWFPLKFIQRGFWQKNNFTVFSQKLLT